MRLFVTVSTLYLIVASLHGATAIPLDVNDNGKLFAHGTHLDIMSDRHLLIGRSP